MMYRVLIVAVGVTAMCGVPSAFAADQPAIEKALETDISSRTVKNVMSAFPSRRK